MVDESIIEAVKTYLQNLVDWGIPVTYGVLYGSRVSGGADQWSDIDLLVVSPRFDAPHTWEDTRLLWHVAARTDNRIEPLPVGVRQFDEDDSSAIIEIARRAGQVIPLAG